VIGVALGVGLLGTALSVGYAVCVGFNDKTPKATYLRTLIVARSKDASVETDEFMGIAD